MGSAERIHRIATRFGISVGRRPARDSIWRVLQREFRCGRVEAVIEVGSHHGGYIRALRSEVGFRGLIVALEPSPSAFEVLAERYGRADGVRLLPRAAGAAPGTAHLHEYSDSQFSSVHRLSAEAARSLNWINLERTTAVPVVTVGQVIEEEGLRGSRIHLSIDAQGHDQEVLRGAVDALDCITSVQVEASISRLYEARTDVVQMVELLDEIGFGVCGVFPAGFHPATGRLLDVDLVATRRATGVVGPA